MNDDVISKPAVLIAGMGEVGRRLRDGALHQGHEVTTLGRRDDLAAAIGAHRGPIVLAMREDDLGQALALVPTSRANDLVIVQNGFIDSLLETHPGHTRVVVWFTSKGEFFASARESLASGPYAAACASWIAAHEVPARVESVEVVLQEAREKAAWSCLVGPALAAHRCSYAQMFSERQEDAQRIVYEACDMASRTLDATVTRDGAWAMVEACVGSLGWMRGGTKGLAFRNGCVVRWAEELGDGMAAVMNGEVVRLLAQNT